MKYCVFFSCEIVLIFKTPSLGTRKPSMVKGEEKKCSLASIRGNWCLGFMGDKGNRLIRTKNGVHLLRQLRLILDNVTLLFSKQRCWCVGEKSLACLAQEELVRYILHWVRKNLCVPVSGAWVRFENPTPRDGAPRAELSTPVNDGWGIFLTRFLSS